MAYNNENKVLITFSVVTLTNVLDCDTAEMIVSMTTLSISIQCHFAECRYAECRYAGCRDANKWTSPCVL